MSVWRTISTLLIGLLLGFLAFGVKWNFTGEISKNLPEFAVSFVEFSGIALMAAAVSVAALTLVTALVAIFGFGFIRNEAAKKAVDAAETKVSEIATAALDQKLDTVLEAARRDGTLADAIARALQGPDYSDADDLETDDTEIAD